MQSATQNTTRATTTQAPSTPATPALGAVTTVQQKVRAAGSYAEQLQLLAPEGGPTGAENKDKGAPPATFHGFTLARIKGIQGPSQADVASWFFALSAGQRTTAIGQSFALPNGTERDALAKRKPPITLDASLWHAEVTTTLKAFGDAQSGMALTWFALAVGTNHTGRTKLGAEVATWLSALDLSQVTSVEWSEILRISKDLANPQPVRDALLNVPAEIIAASDASKWPADNAFATSALALVRAANPERAAAIDKDKRGPVPAQGQRQEWEKSAREQLLQAVADPVTRAWFIDGLATANVAVCNDFKERTEFIRPLPPEAMAVVNAAWELASAGDTPNIEAMRRLTELRFGMKVSGAPTAEQLRATWSAIGRLPQKHVESTNAVKNAGGEKPGTNDPDSDPVTALALNPATNGNEFATAGDGVLDFHMGERNNANRYKQYKAGEKDPAGDSNLPADDAKSGIKIDPKTRDAFEKAGVTHFSHSMLHEWGHALDRSRGLMDSGAYNTADWRTHDAPAAAAALTADMGLDAPGVTEAGAAQRKAIQDTLAAKGPAPVLDDGKNATGMWAGLDAVLAAAKAKPVWKWMENQRGGAARIFSQTPHAIQERVYLYNPSPDFPTWGSYSYAARKATSVSNYQWKTHREWFAECYAVYYDSQVPGELLRQRDPKMAAALDQLHRDGRAPGTSQPVKR